MLSPHSLLLSQALFPIPNLVLGAHATENDTHDMEDKVVKCFQNIALKKEMKTIREVIAIRDKELKPNKNDRFSRSRKQRQKLNSYLKTASLISHGLSTEAERAPHATWQINEK